MVKEALEGMVVLLVLPPIVLVLVAAALVVQLLARKMAELVPHTLKPRLMLLRLHILTRLVRVLPEVRPE
jgi:hypothetical protein